MHWRRLDRSLITVSTLAGRVWPELAALPRGLGADTLRARLRGDSSRDLVAHTVLRTSVGLKRGARTGYDEDELRLPGDNPRSQWHVLSYLRRRTLLSA